jgi:hypothetical protein
MSLLLLWLTSVQASAGASACAGYYSYIPRSIAHDVAFSVQVQPTVIEVLYTDYDNMFARKEVQRDGSIRFNDGRGGPFFHLKCDAQGATLSVDADEHNRARTYRLVRTRSNIWAIARARHWPVEE